MRQVLSTRLECTCDAARSSRMSWMRNLEKATVFEWAFRGDSPANDDDIHLERLFRWNVPFVESCLTGSM